MRVDRLEQGGAAQAAEPPDPLGAEPGDPVHPMLLRIHQLRWIALFGLLGAAVLLALAFATGHVERTVARLRAASSSAAQPSQGDRDGSMPAAIPTPQGEDGAMSAATPTLVPVPTPGAATATLPPAAGVGLIPGHWQFDTGAVCADGLREVDVTLDVAQRVQAILAARGITAELLPEHDPKRPEPPIQGFRGAALVSIHADSCQFPGLSGFKTARWRYSRTPEADDRLIRCLNRAYAGATGLPRHDDTISADMRDYYAFREIALDTPAAIIELAFLRDDRAFVDAHRYEMAMGVANGIGCFLRGP